MLRILLFPLWFTFERFIVQERKWFNLVVPIVQRLNRERTICGVFNEINANLGRLDRSQILMSSTGTRGRWTVVSIPHSANLPSLLHVLGQKTVGIEPNRSATIREWRNNGYKGKAFHNQPNWEIFINASVGKRLRFYTFCRTCVTSNSDYTVWFSNRSVCSKSRLKLQSSYHETISIRLLFQKKYKIRFIFHWY